MKLRLLDLFSGIGGFSLGLERTGGFQTVAFCEIDPYCRRVLAKHWPNVRQYDDIRDLTASRLAADGVSVDAICGGFPCQDISFAGKGAGIEGERSGLWSEYARLVGELRPRYVIVENVAALLGRGLDRVLGDLAALGYDAEWHCIPASAVGAPHRRDRLWIVAHAGDDVHAPRLVGGGTGSQASRGEGGNSRKGEAPHWQWLRAELGPGCEALADADSERLESGRLSDFGREAVFDAPWRGEDVAHSERRGLQGWYVERSRSTAILSPSNGRDRGGGELGAAWWSEPDVGRVAYGLPNGMDRLRALGNAVVPQIPELIGRAILQSTREAA